MFRIAKNACLMQRRRSMYAPGEESPWKTRGVNSAISLHCPTCLPPYYRAVVLLRDVEELTTWEAAGVLEISTHSVKQCLHRARLALRKYMIGKRNPRLCARAGVLDA